MLFEFKSVRTRLNVWFLLVALIPLMAAVSIIYFERVSSIKAESFQRLVAIRDLKVSQLNIWLEEKTGDIKLLAEVPTVRSLKSIITYGRKSVQDQAKMDEVRVNLKSRIKNYNDYTEVFLISAQTGRVVLASRQDLEGADRSKNLFFTEPLKTRSFFIKDIHYSKTLNKPALTFSAPVFDIDNKDELIAILVARIDLNQSLYNMLLARPGMGETGETLIVNKDVIALNELRWYDNAPLNLKIHAFPAVQSSKGNTGIIEIEDYRKKKVLAAYTHIPLTGWGFIAKQDLDEIYKPIKDLLRNSLIIMLCSCVFVCITAIVISKGILAPLISMTALANRLKNGEYSVRNSMQRSDEFGSLAESIDSMADTLTGQMNVQNGVSKVLDSVVDASEVTDFTKTLLEDLLKLTSSDLGVFHLLDENQKQYVAVNAIGADSKLIQPVNAQQLSGEIGKAVSLKEICHLQNISEETFFQLETFAGKIVPREIITIPLLNMGKVEAVVSLASISGYSLNHLEIIKTAWRTLNTGLSSLHATEKTRLLANELQETNVELKEQRFELQRQSDELQEQNVELETQRQQVEEATRLKSEFLSNMSHELRTPLNSIMALSKVLILETEKQLDDEQRNYLEVISRNGKKLLKLINDILDLAKIEAGRMDLTPKTFSVRHFLETIIEGFDLICLEKGIEISLQLEEKIPHIKSDEIRVNQILQNIISNAVKFTNKGCVSITAKHDRNHVVITIHDTGIGITEKDLPYIFGEFRQVDGSSSRSFEGTGLGLAIAKKSAALLGAEITVSSTSGEGTCFTVKLPIVWHGNTLPDIQPDEPLLLSKTSVRQKNKTILVVDDEPDTAKTIANYLTDAGYNTLIALSGKEAVEITRTHELFAMTLDIGMPDMDGWEVLQQLKRDPKTVAVPVIIVSVSDDNKTGFALGATDFITKPVNRDQLAAAIMKLSQVKVESVMVVDDNEMDRQNIVRMLVAQSLEVRDADSGPRCFELLAEGVPDLIVLDLMMPGMSGSDVLDRLRNAPNTRNIPIIIVTAKDLTTEEKRLLQEQMTLVIEKDKLSINTFWLKLQDYLEDLNQSIPDVSFNNETAKNKILIVEDNPDTILQVKYVLTKAGYEVSTAGSGSEALEYIKHTIPDGIILDLMMPEIDGFEVLEEIRGTDKTACIPVLILTAKDLTKADLQRLSHNNIQQLIQKGDIDVDGLLFKIDVMLGNQPKTQKLPQEKAPSDKNNGMAQVKSSVRRVSSGKPVLLIVEDNPDNMITLKAILKNKYTLLEAYDGEEGLQKAVHSSPDLVFLDMSLPKMDGYEVVRQLKKDTTTKAIPIVALTAHAMKGDQEKILAAGCDDYISKPVDPEKILDCLKKWLEIAPKM